MFTKKESTYIKRGLDVIRDQYEGTRNYTFKDDTLAEAILAKLKKQPKTKLAAMITRSTHHTQSSSVIERLFNTVEECQEWFNEATNDPKVRAVDRYRFRIEDDAGEKILKTMDGDVYIKVTFHKVKV